MAERRPSVFIGSSAEGLTGAKAIQVNLDRACEVVIWCQGVFGLSGGTLETLVDKASEFDFAILVLTPDDMIESRGDNQQSPRDNVLLETGLFAGVLGRKRTFIVYDRSAGIKVPSDLAGVTLASYQPHASGNLQASMGAACTQFETAIKEMGLRERQRRIGFEIDQNTHFQIICNLLDESALQFFILMHEQGLPLHRESLFGEGIRYAYVKGRASGEGHFSVDSFCQKLPDAGLLQADLRNNVTLTGRGHEFAAWLIERGHKADAFKSTVGSWGGDIPPLFPGTFTEPQTG